MKKSAPSLAIVRSGTLQPDKPGRILKAGPMSVEFDNGQLRYLKVNGVEVLRAVGFLVRDENWGTYVPVISQLKIRQRADSFSVSFHAACHRADQQIDYDATIEGQPNGELKFIGRALPGTDFLTARTGFVVLHPLKGVASQPVRVEHVDGSIANDVFPEAVDPVQPFLNIRSLSHQVVPGLRATVLMEGDTFEMEDHRNWTDASFKTYVRPLIRPWPYVLKAGKEVRQSISVTLDGSSPVTRADNRQKAVQIKLGQALATRLPSLGLGMPAGEIPATLENQDWLELLAPKFLVCQFDPREKHGLKELQAYRDLCAQSGAKAVLEVVVSRVRGFEAELKKLAKLVQKSALELASIQVVPAGDLKSVLPGGKRPPAPELAALYAAARESFPGVELGGGMLTFFTELNRKRVPTQNLDYVHNTTCPIVHAADDRSVMETLEAVPYQVRTARDFIGKRAYRVGPSGIGCRDNPHGASWTPNPDNERVCLTRLDPRQRGLFGAAWTLGYIATLVRAGVDAVSIGAPTGPLGLIYRRADHSQPWFDSLNQPAVFPAFHVFCGLANSGARQLVDVNSSEPEAVECLAYRADDGGTTLWLANLTAQEQDVRLELPLSASKPDIQGAILDEHSFQTACTSPREFQASATRQTKRLTLRPYAVAILAIAG